MDQCGTTPLCAHGLEGDKRRNKIGNEKCFDIIYKYASSNKNTRVKTVMDYLYCSINKWSLHITSSHTIDFSEHGIHILQVVVVEKPHTWLSLILVKRNYRKKQEENFRIRFW